MEANILVKEATQPKLYRFEVFKGFSDDFGKIRRVKSIGEATHLDGTHTYQIRIAAIEEVEFFLLPEKHDPSRDFSILRRKPSADSSKKYLWTTVGEAKLLSGLNSGFLKLEWDFFGADDVYLNLQPKPSSP